MDTHRNDGSKTQYEMCSTFERVKVEHIAKVPYIVHTAGTPRFGVQGRFKDRAVIYTTKRGVSHVIICSSSGHNTHIGE